MKRPKSNDIQLHNVGEESVPVCHQLQDRPRERWQGDVASGRKVERWETQDGEEACNNNNTFIGVVIPRIMKIGCPLGQGSQRTIVPPEMGIDNVMN